jgi:RNA polymerase sigma factor (sigma-70 family)
VYAYVAYRIGAGPDAEDVTSEAFARALRYRKGYDAARGTPVAWLTGIARRVLAERAGAEPQPVAEVPDTPAPGTLEDDSVNRLTMQTAVAGLGDRDRELIALRYGADLTAAQIAQLLDMQTNAAEVALHRALARLREVLDPAPSPIRPAAAPPAEPGTSAASA